MSLTKVSYSMIDGASINVLDFGADPTGTTNSTSAFAAASAAIEAADGGKLVIPEGLYIVGEQTFAGQAGLGYAYSPSKIIDIRNCNNPVIIEGNGAVLKIANGLRFGAFNPVTGLPIVTVPPYTVADSQAAIGDVINIFNCRSLAITDLELDGNINNQIIGGFWGDTGRQLSARGVYDQQNDSVVVSNVYAHHHGLDGFETQRTATTSTTTVYPHTYINCRSTYNGRQGMSWTGGNNLTLISCDFSHTGKNGVVSSSPAAGLDIEPEGGIGANGTFINCRFYDNTGVGVLASSGSSSDCSFYSCQMIGTTNWSGWTQFPRYRFHDCTIVGAWVYPGGSSDPENAARWSGCKFFMDPAKSPSGVIYGTYMDFDASSNVIFESCVFFSVTGYTLPFSISGITGTVYSNCTFEQVGAGTFYTRGNFYGHCQLTHAGTWDAAGSKIFGRFYVNGVESRIVLPVIETLSMASNDGGAGSVRRTVSHYSPTVWAAEVGGAIQGDIVLNPLPTAGGFIGSVCTVTGNPGTWRTYGVIS